MPKQEMGDRYRWGQHQRGGFWEGTDRLKNRKLEVLPTRIDFLPGATPADALRKLIMLLETDFIAAQAWEGL